MRTFARFGWLVLSWNVAVVLWGAFVRATGSGAGCGGHWPLCNGAVVPREPTTATIIEYTHRLTSGLALLAVVTLCVWAFRAFPKGHLARKAAAASVVFILAEALLGAGLVLLDYVEQNKSLGRAVYLSAHLTNTLLLVGSLAAAAWFGGRGDHAEFRGAPPLVVFALMATLVAGISGAVAALGDTVFPATSLTQGMKAELAPGAHALLKLRLVHPVLAALVGVFLLWVGMKTARASRAGRAVVGLVVLQVTAGAVDVVLLAPVWLQFVHLLLANLLWISLVLLLLDSGSKPARVS
jgi:cytochrome c oxidase assembly protein subunit 15